MPVVSWLEKLSYALQRSITPGLRYSQTIFEAELRTQVPVATHWLDLGCGHRLLPEWRDAAEAELMRMAPFVVGLDADFDALRRHRSIHDRCVGDIGQLPFKAESFDLVTANMVVEHLADPEVQFKEVARVLMAGGTFVFHTPNLRSYIVATARLLPDGVKRTLARLLEDRVAEDVYPTHYRANDRSAIERIAAASGFVVERLDFVNTSPVLNLVPPLLVPELVWIRQTQRRPSLEEFRPVLICVLRKRGYAAHQGEKA